MKSNDTLRTGTRDILEGKDQLAPWRIETVPPPTLRRPRCEGCTYNIVTFYEDFEFAMRASKAFGLLVRNFCNDLPDPSICATSWSFGMLGMSRLTTAVFRLSASADVLVVSANSDKDLPPQIAMWVERCISRKPNAEPVLVALVDDELEPNSSEAPLCLSLLQIANRRQARFRCNRDLKEGLKHDFPAEPCSDGLRSPIRETIRRPPPMQNQGVIGLDSSMTPQSPGNADMSEHGSPTRFLATPAQKKESLLKTSPSKHSPIDDIVWAAYDKFARGEDIRTAMSLCFRKRGKAKSLIQ